MLGFGGKPLRGLRVMAMWGGQGQDENEQLRENGERGVGRQDGDAQPEASLLALGSGDRPRSLALVVEARGGMRGLRENGVSQGALPPHRISHCPDGQRPGTAARRGCGPLTVRVAKVADQIESSSEPRDLN